MQKHAFRPEMKIFIINFYLKGAGMTKYMTILFNTKTKKVADAFETEIEKLTEDPKNLPVKKIEPIENLKDKPGLDHLKGIHPITVLYTESTRILWIMVNGRLKLIRL